MTAIKEWPAWQPPEPKGSAGPCSSDLLAGVATTKDDALWHALRKSRELTGATPGALEAFLAVRGARTLALRLARAQQTAMLRAVESTMERRAAIPGQAHLPPSLLRLSVGIEDPGDLWSDLEAAISLLHRDSFDGAAMLHWSVFSLVQNSLLVPVSLSSLLPSLECLSP